MKDIEKRQNKNGETLLDSDKEEIGVKDNNNNTDSLKCEIKQGKYDCSKLFNCCCCGGVGGGCGCRECFDCNACDNCKKGG